MLNLVIISPGFPVNEEDSVCLPFLQVYIKALIKNKNIRLTVITEQYPAKENYVWYGVNVITLRKNEPALYQKLARYTRLKKALKQLHAVYKLDAIHNFWFTRSALVAGAFAFKNKIRHLTTFSGQDVLPENRMLTKLSSYTGQLFCLSAFHREKLMQHTGIAATVIEPGIEDIAPATGEKTIDLMFCGWITALKNYSQFLDIVAALHKNRALSRVVMCGGGEGLIDLKEKIKLLGVQNLVDVKGETPRAEVIALMRKSKVLVHTSDFESFGLVLIEALACNCYVLAKPVGIAYSHPGISTCQSTEAFIERAGFYLGQSPGKEAPRALYPINATVRHYLDVYSA